MSLFCDDLDIFFTEDGEAVTVEGLTVTALFDRPFEFGTQQQESYLPRVTLKTADISTIVRPLQGKTLTRDITMVDYKIITTIDDGAGITILELRE